MPIETHNGVVDPASRTVPSGGSEAHPPIDPIPSSEPPLPDEDNPYHLPNNENDFNRKYDEETFIEKEIEELFEVIESGKFKFSWQTGILSDSNRDSVFPGRIEDGPTIYLRTPSDLFILFEEIGILNYEEYRTNSVTPGDAVKLDFVCKIA